MAVATRCKGGSTVLEAQDSKHRETAVLTALIGRVSPLRLVEPAPVNADLDQILAAGLRAPVQQRAPPNPLPVPTKLAGTWVPLCQLL